MKREGIESILINADEISRRTDEIAKQISEDYKGEQVVMICILRGATLFFADLVRKVDLETNFDFMEASSYGAGVTTSGEVRIIKDISTPIKDKNIIIVEDIIDSGNTLSFLKKILAQREPKSIKIASLLDKPERREVEIKGDYVGFEIPNVFVVGYGLDYNERYRNLPDVCILSPKVYA